MSDGETVVRRGTDNLFADLGFDDPDVHLLKAQLVGGIHDAIRGRKLARTQAAQLLGLSQPELSRLLQGQVRDVSVERIPRVPSHFGCEIDILVTAAWSEVPGPAIRFRPAARAESNALSSPESHRNRWSAD